MKTGELCSLKYDSSDFENDIVHITENSVKVEGITYINHLRLIVE